MTRSLPLALDTNSAVLRRDEDLDEFYKDMDGNNEVDMSTTDLPKSDEEIIKNRINNPSVVLNQKHFESEKGVTMGICTAILIFFVILTIFIVNMRKSRPNDKETLIDNEVGVDVLNTQTVHV